MKSFLCIFIYLFVMLRMNKEIICSTKLCIKAFFNPLYFYLIFLKLSKTPFLYKNNQNNSER